MKVKILVAEDSEEQFARIKDMPAAPRVGDGIVLGYYPTAQRFVVASVAWTPDDADQDVSVMVRRHS